MDLMKPFEIVHKGETVQVMPRKIGPDHVYIIDFPSRRPPIMLTKATRQGDEHFWTTIPEEKDKKAKEAALAEAAKIGQLIMVHYLEETAAIK